MLVDGVPASSLTAPAQFAIEPRLRQAPIPPDRATETFSASAVSSRLNPPKNRNSTTGFAADPASRGFSGHRPAPRGPAWSAERPARPRTTPASVTAAFGPAACAGGIHENAPHDSAATPKKCARFCQWTCFQSTSRTYASLTSAVACSSGRAARLPSAGSHAVQFLVHAGSECLRAR